MQGQGYLNFEICIRNSGMSAALFALVLTVVMPTAWGAVISLNAPSASAQRAWQNPCAGGSSAADRLSLLRARRDVGQQRSALSSIIVRLDDTLNTIDLVQDQLLVYYSGNIQHLPSAAASQASAEILSDDIDTYVVALYRSLARVASYLHHMRHSLANHEHRFSYRKLLDLLRVLENGGVVSGEVNNGGIYHIMCDIYRLVATSGGDTSDLAIDDIEHEHPRTIAQLHDKFFLLLKSTQALVHKLQRSFPAGF